jgi:hypothetical protein
MSVMLSPLSRIRPTTSTQRISTISGTLTHVAGERERERGREERTELSSLAVSLDGDLRCRVQNDVHELIESLHFHQIVPLKAPRKRRVSAPSYKRETREQGRKEGAKRTTMVPSILVESLSYSQIWTLVFYRFTPNHRHRLVSYT